jgi:integrase
MEFLETLLEFNPRSPPKTHQTPEKTTAMNRLKSDKGIRTILLDDGSKRYEARIHRIGEKAVSKRFKTKEQALKWKRALDTSIDNGGVVTPNKSVLIRTVIEEYLKFRNGEKKKPLPSNREEKLAYRKVGKVKPIPSNRKEKLAFRKGGKVKPIPSNRVTDYERVKDDLGDFIARKITKDDLRGYVELLGSEPIKRDRKLPDSSPKRTYAEASIRKFLFALKIAMRWHAEKNQYPFDPEVFNLGEEDMPKAWSGNRERRLEDGEEERLYKSAINRPNAHNEQDWRAIIGFALETAMREQEIVFARWSDLGPDNLLLRIPKEHVKTRKERIVPLSKRAREIVEDQRRNRPDKEARIFYQFPTPNAVCESFARLVKRAEIDNLKFHDLRHEATTRICLSGKLNLFEIMAMTGHTNQSTFQGYIHLVMGQTRTLD